MSIKALPPMTHTFTLKVTGENTARVYEGTFNYKRPNIRVDSEIAKTKAMLDGGLANLDEDTQYFHKIHSILRHTLTEVPDWFKECNYGLDLYDYNISLEIYKEINKFEKEWQEKVWKSDEKKEEEVKQEV